MLIYAEGAIAAARMDLDLWMKTLPQPWTTAMEATIFTGWLYDYLLPYALLQRSGGQKISWTICRIPVRPFVYKVKLGQPPRYRNKRASRALFKNWTGRGVRGSVNFAARHFVWMTSWMSRVERRLVCCCSESLTPEEVR